MLQRKRFSKLWSPSEGGSEGRGKSQQKGGPGARKVFIVNLLGAHGREVGWGEGTPVKVQKQGGC